MRTNNIPSCYRESKRFIMPTGLALSSTLIISNYPCLELIFIVLKVFEPLKFNCTCNKSTMPENASIYMCLCLHPSRVKLRTGILSNYLKQGSRYR